MPVSNCLTLAPAPQNTGCLRDGCLLLPSYGGHRCLQNRIFHTSASHHSTPCLVHTYLAAELSRCYCSSHRSYNQRAQDERTEARGEVHTWYPCTDLSNFQALVGVLTGATQAVVDFGTTGHYVRAQAVTTDCRVLAMVVVARVVATSLLAR